MFLAAILIVIMLPMAYVFHEKNESLKIDNRKLKQEVAELKKTIEELKANGTAENIVPEKTMTNIAEQIVSETIVSDVQEVKTAEEKIEEEKIEAKKETIQQKSPEELKREELENKRKAEKKELERRNTTIMATGAILVILATIVFLSSTWSMLNKGIKVIGLLLFLVIFYGASKISKDKFKLENTSKTFFYLAMAYIPICFLSLSLFELLGENFSIHGDGFKLYLFLSTLVTSVIYFYFYVSKNNKLLFYGSMIAQTTSMVILALVFEGEMPLIVLLVLAYNLLIGLVLNGEAKELISDFIFLIPVIAIILAISFAFDADIIILGIFVLIPINFLMIILRYSNTEAMSYLANVSLYAAGFYFAFVFLKNFDNDLRIAMAVIYFLFVYVLERTLINGNEKYMPLRKSLNIVNLCSYALLYIFSGAMKGEYIKPYMVAIIAEIFLLFTYMRNREGILGDILRFLVPIALLLILFEINSYLPFVSFVYLVIVMVIVGEIFRKTKYSDLNNSFVIITNVFMIYAYYKVLTSSADSTIINKLILTACYVYYWYRERKTVYKYLMYLAIGVCISNDVNIMDICNLKSLAPAILSIAVIVLETAYPKLKDDYSNMFIALIIAIGYIGILHIKKDIEIILALIYTVLVYFHMTSDKVNRNYRLVPLIGLFYTITNSNVGTDMIVIWETIYVIALTLVSIFESKVAHESILAGIMLICFIRPEINNDLISSISILMWSIVNMCVSKDDKIKDLFKSLTIFSGLYLYITVVREIGFTTFNSIYFIGGVIALSLFIELIVNKYFKEDITKIECAIFAILYIATYTVYTSGIDAIIFTLFLMLYSVALSQRNNKGIYLTTALAVVVNVALIQESRLIIAAIGTAWAAISLSLSKEEKFQDLFKGIAILSIFNLYIVLLPELGLSEMYNAPYFIGVTITFAALVEFVLRKCLKDNMTIIENVVYIILYIVAFANYKGEKDGIIFAIFLILYAVASFTNQKSKVFKINIGAIVVNAIALTRNFWLSLPWWIYLLIAGSGLIGFAVMNESRSNKERIAQREKAGRNIDTTSRIEGEINSSIEMQNEDNNDNNNGE